VNILFYAGEQDKLPTNGLERGGRGTMLFGKMAGNCLALLNNSQFFLGLIFTSGQTSPINQGRNGSQQISDLFLAF
jgi:hypothetical protein